ncbi:MAG: glycoside hydrolase family 2 protein [Bacteroidetes bacterium]|nr:glycoside hydrolase family 2 protein [Bacteroidota bacterium]
MKIRNKVLVSFVFYVALARLSAQQVVPLNWQLKAIHDSTWSIAAKVPGSVYADLRLAGKIPDPYFGTNENKVAWVDTTSWEYETEIEFTKEQVANPIARLVFEGLDTYAEIWLNDSKLGDCDNMFRAWSFLLKGRLKEGRNTLKVRFLPTSRIAKSAYDKLLSKLPIDERVIPRKAQYQFGWDWGPKLIGAGIYKAVYFSFPQKIELRYSSIRTKSIENNTAKMELELHVQASRKMKLNVKLQELSKLFRLTNLSWAVNKGLNKILIRFDVPNPQLWWPHDYGTPYLYTAQLLLEQESNVLHQATTKFGIRQVALQRQKDLSGESFLFLVNGKKVFAKGANYIPMDAMPGTVSVQKQQELLLKTRNANMNMIRVWGGGMYESDRFYELCDSLGILVWQDLMFACSFYPGDTSFVKQIEQEVKYQVQRLKGHPSLVLWCGNNEVDEAWFNWGYQKAYGYSQQDSIRIRKEYEKVFHQLIPGILNQLDPNRPYHASSPLFGWGRKESMTHGDAHYWGVWWGEEPFEKYLEKVPRFMSEYGFQALPNRETMTEMGALSKPVSDSVWKQHQKHSRGFELIEQAMNRYAFVPNHIDDYAYLSQHLQAKAYKMAVEAHRRAKPYCMGTLVWQLNDCWPVVSWSVLDYNLRTKASYHQLKTSYQPIALSVSIKDSAILCYVLNDAQMSGADTLTWSLKSLSGVDLRQGIRPFNLIQDSSQVVLKLPLSDLEGFRKEEVYFQCSIKNQTETLLLSHEMDINWPTTPILVNWKQQGKSWFIELESTGLQKGVMLRAEIPGEFSENYFDLLPNEHKVIRFDAENEDSLKLHFRSLNMLYNQHKNNAQN